MSGRLLVKVTRETLPQIKDRYPFIYLERGRLEVDDSSIKWIDCDCNVVRIPCATLCAILLGPGTTVTHEAIKVLGAANCMVSWVGEDAMLFYACGLSPTADTRNMRTQMQLAADEGSATVVARRMFARRFPKANLEGKSIPEMMGMEGMRVKQLYEQMAEKHGVGWRGRNFQPGKFEFSDITNKYLTSANAALYGVLSAAVHSLGYSPHIGFIHSGSPLPFVYDLADLYKEHHCIDLAFYLTLESAGIYDKALIAAEFRKRMLESNVLANIATDIATLFRGVARAGRDS
jgi:CRISPR-associated protein Cas1